MDYPANLYAISNFVSARPLAACMLGFLCAFILAPPVLLSTGHIAAASAVYFFFSPFCHQTAERSFIVLGFPLAVCHRCSGIYLGLLIGSLLDSAWIHKSSASRRRWVLAATVPLALDALLPYCGLWTSTGGSRFITGLFFGILAAFLLVRGIEELLHEAPWRRFAFGDSNLRETSYEPR